MNKTKILILAANPIDTSQLRLDKEVREIENGLERAKNRDSFLVKSIWATRPLDLRRQMLDFQPDIVHFCGHGAGSLGIAFERDNGTSKLVTAPALAGFFELFSDKVKYVILNACYSKVQAEAISNHIDYVIGMKKEIGDDSAIDFAVALYDALGAGKGISFAYKLACNSLMWSDTPENLTPILIKKQNSLESVGSSVDEYIETKKVNQPVRTIRGVLFSPEKEELRMTMGFFLTVGAALSWGVGNAVTKWTMVRFPKSSYDITLLKYLVAAIFLISIGLVLKKMDSNSPSFYTILKKIKMRAFLCAAFAKGMNIYCWIVAATFSSAGLVSALENMHVVWTALILFVVLGVKFSTRWIITCMVIMMGVLLISDILTSVSGTLDLKGVALGGLAGLSFSVFSIIWTRTEHSNLIWERTIEMAFLLLMGGLLVYPVHLIVNEIWLHGSMVPFSEISLMDAGIQAINGIIGIGGTYFLINESVAMLKNAKINPSLLLGLGLSFAVPITMFSETLFLNLSIEPIGWIGAILFVLGYTIMRSDLQEKLKN